MKRRAWETELDDLAHETEKKAKMGFNSEGEEPPKESHVQIFRHHTHVSIRIVDNADNLAIYTICAHIAKLQEMEADYILCARTSGTLSMLNICLVADDSLAWQSVMRILHEKFPYEEDFGIEMLLLLETIFPWIAHETNTQHPKKGDFKHTLCEFWNRLKSQKTYMSYTSIVSVIKRLAERNDPILTDHVLRILYHWFVCLEKKCPFDEGLGGLLSENRMYTFTYRPTEKIWLSILHAHHDCLQFALKLCSRCCVTSFDQLRDVLQRNTKGVHEMEKKARPLPYYEVFQHAVWICSLIHIPEQPEEWKRFTLPGFQIQGEWLRQLEDNLNRKSVGILAPDWINDIACAGGALVECALAGVAGRPDLPQHVWQNSDIDLWGENIAQDPEVLHRIVRDMKMDAIMARPQQGGRKNYHKDVAIEVLIPGHGIRISLLKKKPFSIGTFDLDYVRAIYIRRHKIARCFLTPECAESWVSGRVVRTFAHPIDPQRVLEKAVDRGFVIDADILSQINVEEMKSQKERRWLICPMMKTRRALQWLNTMYDQEYEFTPVFAHTEKEASLLQDPTRPDVPVHPAVEH